MTGIAALVGILGYAAPTALAYSITQRTDSSMGTLLRNRYILSGIAFLAGIFVARKHPIIGTALAAGGAVSALGSKTAIAIGTVTDKKDAAATSGLAAVFGQNMQGYAPAMNGYAPAMAAVYGQNMSGYQLGMSAVYGQNMQGMGHPGMTPPWRNENPF